MARFEIDLDYLAKTLVDLLHTPSPSGDTEWAVAFVEQEFAAMGLETRRTPKGSLLVRAQGLASSSPRALSAHVDTLGAMVSGIKPSGRLSLTNIGSKVWPTLDSEGVTVATRSGRQIRGSIVLVNGAQHVNPDSGAARTESNLEVRIDERTASAEETRLLGIETGDFVYFDTRTERSQAGFIRSRFLDDKAGVACILAAVKALRDQQITPAQRTDILISVFEEVGHGGLDGLPDDLEELVVVDMACIGTGLAGSEFHCSICVKDGGGPYSKRLTDKLRAISEQRGIELKADVYPFYSSDGTVYWRGGGRAEVALIGPGVDTSHGYERTHIDALGDTATILAEYLVG